MNVALLYAEHRLWSIHTVASWGGRDQSEDIVQEAFIRLLRSTVRVVDYPRALILVFLRRTWYDFVKGQRRDRRDAALSVPLTVLGENDVVASGDLCEQVVARTEITAALDSLPTFQRAALLRSILSPVKLDATTKTLTARARKSLNERVAA